MSFAFSLYANTRTSFVPDKKHCGEPFIVLWQGPHYKGVQCRICHRYFSPRVVPFHALFQKRRNVSMPKKKQPRSASPNLTNCPLCKTDVLTAEFASHLQEHQQPSAPSPAAAPVPAVTSTPPGMPPGMYQPPTPSAAAGAIPPPVLQPRNPFLSGNLLGQLSQGKGVLENVTITGVRQGVSKFGPSWSLDLNIAGGAYTLTVKQNSSKHAKLWEKFRDQWVGKTISLRWGNPAAGEKEHVAIV